MIEIINLFELFLRKIPAGTGLAME